MKEVALVLAVIAVIAGGLWLMQRPASIDNRCSNIESVMLQKELQELRDRDFWSRHGEQSIAMSTQELLSMYADSVPLDTTPPLRPSEEVWYAEHCWNGKAR